MINLPICRSRNRLSCALAYQASTILMQHLPFIYRNTPFKKMPPAATKKQCRGPSCARKKKANQGHCSNSQGLTNQKWKGCLILWHQCNLGTSRCGIIKNNSTIPIGPCPTTSSPMWLQSSSHSCYCMIPSLKSGAASLADSLPICAHITILLEGIVRLGFCMGTTNNYTRISWEKQLGKEGVVEMLKRDVCGERGHSTHNLEGQPLARTSDWVENGAIAPFAPLASDQQGELPSTQLSLIQQVWSTLTWAWERVLYFLHPLHPHLCSTRGRCQLWAIKPKLGSEENGLEKAAPLGPNIKRQRQTWGKDLPPAGCWGTTLPHLLCALPPHHLPSSTSVDGQEITHTFLKRCHVHTRVPDQIRTCYKWPNAPEKEGGGCFTIKNDDPSPFS